MDNLARSPRARRSNMSENYNPDVVGQLIGDLSDPEGLRDSEIIAQIRAVIAKEDN